MRSFCTYIMSVSTASMDKWGFFERAICKRYSGRQYEMKRGSSGLRWLAVLDL